MSPRIVWKGLAVVDRAGRIHTWRGSNTPKLFHSEEQATHHRTDGDVFAEVHVVLCPETAQPSPVGRLIAQALGVPLAEITKDLSADLRADPPKRKYAARRCRKCKRLFTPTGPNCPYCGEC